MWSQLPQLKTDRSHEGIKSNVFVTGVTFPSQYVSGVEVVPTLLVLFVQYTDLMGDCMDQQHVAYMFKRVSPLFCPQTQRHITDLYEDLRDGHNLISLLEVLSGETLVSSWWPLTFRYQDIRFCCNPPPCPVQTFSSRPRSSVTWFAVITVLLSRLLIVTGPYC